MTVLRGELAGRVAIEAARVRPGRALLTVLAAAFWALGWLAAAVFTVVGVAVRWSVAAVLVGWADGRAMTGGRRGPAR